jgi:hypothetical protein
MGVDRRNRAALFDEHIEQHIERVGRRFLVARPQRDRAVHR